MGDPTIERLIEEYLEHRLDGSVGGAAEFLEQHPEHRDVLARRLEQLERLSLLSAGSGPKFDVARSFDGFEIVRELGRGGMGVVYEARQLALGRSVAIKVIAGSGLGSPRLEERFEREIAALARISHPNIVKVFGTGYVREAPYIVMELVSGESLERRLQGPPARTSEQFDELVGIGLALARALDHAHEQGVIHRDVKPGNVMLHADGQPVLLDFGLARDERREHVTHSGEFLGTLSYTAPEQARGERVDRRADVYGLGATLFHLATGATPYQARTITDLVRKMESGPPSSAASVNRRVPVELGAVLDRAISSDPKQRYASCADLAEDLQRFQRGEPVLAKSVGMWSDFRALQRRHRVLFASMLTAAVAFGVGGAGFLSKSRELARRTELTHELVRNLRAVISGSDTDKAARERLTAALPALEQSTRALSDSPQLQAASLAAIGQAKVELGDLEAAYAAISESLELREKVLGRDHADTQESVALLGLVHHVNDDYEVAEGLYREACTKLPLGDDESAHNVLLYRHNWAYCLLELGREAEGLQLLEAVIDEQQRRFGERNPDLLTSRNTLARWRMDHGELERAREELERIVALRVEVSGATHPDTLVARSNLAVAFTNSGQHAQAADVMREIVDARVELLGEGDASTLLSMMNLGGILNRAGKPTDARPWLRKAFEGFDHQLGPEHEDTLIALSNLLRTTVQLSLWDEVEPLAAELERRTRDSDEGRAGGYAKVVAEARKALAERK